MGRPRVLQEVTAVVKLLKSKEKGDVFHKAAFKAYFVDGKNIARISVLVDLAVSVGLPGEEAAAVLETRSF